MNMTETALILDPSEDCAPAFRDALLQLSRCPGKKRLVLRSGKYVFHKKNAVRLLLPVSNTLAYGNTPWRHAGLYLDGIDGLVIEGNGAKLLFDGDMTAVAVRNCHDFRMENLSIDYIRPRVSEMTVLRSDGFSADFAIHPDSAWSTDRHGTFCWINADGIPEAPPTRQVVMRALPDRSANLSSSFDPVRSALRCEFPGLRTVRFHYPHTVKLQAGEIYQFRDPSRNEVGIVLDRCNRVTLERLSLCFTPGLGVVAQMCRGLTIRHHCHAPAPESGRVCAAFADCIQISSCRGQVEIADSFFSGTQDDPVNIHGTYLGVEGICSQMVTLKFRHPETWGFLPFEPGDKICFVRRRDLKRMEYGTVKKAELSGMRTVLLELAVPPKQRIEPAEYVVENLSAYPDVRIHGCVFGCHSPRCILMSSAGKCRIYDNVIFQTAPSAAILIAGDAGSWYESGGVRDVKITGNRFRGCRKPAISISPEITALEAAVHRNIEIRGNHFEDCTMPVLQYRGTADLRTDLSGREVREQDCVFS